MSNTLWKIRFSNYEPIDLRDIQSYSIKQNVDDTSPIKEGEMNEEIERGFKDTILYRLDRVFSGIIGRVSWSKDSKYKDRDYFEKLYKKELYYASNRYATELDFRIPKINPFKDAVIGYLTGNENVFSNHYDNIKKWKKKYEFAKENIFECLSDYDKKELKEYLILEKRKKLFTVEFYLKDRTIVKWGAYKTKEEAEIVYNKVNAYFKKTFKHFYENLDNQEIYSL